MDTIEHLRELYAYNDWANRRTVAALKAAQSAQSERILAHLLITEAEYYARLYGKDSTGFDFWRELNLAECSILAKENAEKFERLLKQFDDAGLGQTACYKTSEGVSQQNSYREMLTHVLFHSAVHRGNIVFKMREDGFAPPVTDYIIYLRETKL